ncbi:tetratricopeptide repeat protein [uncultured Cocleimonas sp.]|uniref:tetratricopeptide repeat protein n=1 Tax=uncultured Cocleimonas sp. TaxID=1051587 RepID=UPI00260B15A2|nr:tetratricopeptide repeat protein [uncultured Cocleimonas sp.]
MSSLSTIAKAVSFHKQGKIEKANTAYRKILKKNPKNADVLNYLGMLEFQRGNYDLGIKLTKRCLKVFPKHSAGCNNLANMYMTTYDVDQAEIYYLKSISIDAQAEEPLYNLAVIEKTRKNYEEAEKNFHKVLALNPEHVICISSLADMYVKLGHFEQAMKLLQERLKHVDNHTDQKSSLLSIGRLCLLLNDKKNAIVTYEKCLSIYPNDPMATHMLAAMTGEKVPVKPDEQYVKDLFDGFSLTFDNVLEQLDYKAPQHIQTIIDEIYKETEPHSMRIMDAGCGTGLCGNFLKPLASDLIGVDLSPGMLQRAKFRNEYDELIESDLNLYFQNSTQNFDLIVSADTLCYFGDLKKFLQLSLSSLNPNGRLIFTVEKFDGKTLTGYNLEPHGRYSHTHSYLTESIQESGYKIEDIIVKELRLERGKQVQGYLVVAKAPESLAQ